LRRLPSQSFSSLDAIGRSPASASRSSSTSCSARWPGSSVGSCP